MHQTARDQGQGSDTHHVEGHFESSAVVRDMVIGLADGLTVPFALAAGLSGAVASSRIVVLAGLAEIAAGSIAMGLGGYLAARGDAEHYVSERQREEREIVERTQDEEEEIYEIFEQYSVDRASAAPVLAALKKNPTQWVNFMMRFELGLEEPPAPPADVLLPPVSVLSPVLLELSAELSTVRFRVGVEPPLPPPEPPPRPTT